MSVAPAVILRSAYQSDLPAIAGIQQASGQAAQWNPADYLNYDCRVAWLNNRVVGFVVSRRTAPDECEVLNVAVDPSLRRQGIARALLNAALYPPAPTTQDRWYLEVRESNQVAISLYRAAGFRSAGRRENYYSDPPEAAIVMVLKS